MAINETGAPTGLKRSILIEPTLTSLLSGYRSIEDRSDHELAYSYYQTGPLTKNFFNGKVMIGASGDTGYTSTSILQVTGDIELMTAGNVLKINGSDDTLSTIGSAILSSGTVDVSFVNSGVTNPSIYLTYYDATIPMGILTYTYDPMTGFTINSSNLSDNNTVNYLIIDKT